MDAWVNMDEVLQSVLFFPQQCRQAWEETKAIILKDKPKDVVVAGMGASAYGYYVLKSLFENKLSVPLLLANDYNLPQFTNEHSLVVCMSFSGNTEEVINILTQAIKKNCQVVVLSTGGKLAEIAQRDNLQNCILKNKYNPSGQPRLACGYTVFSLLGVIRQAGLLDLADSQVNDAIKFLEKEAIFLESDPATKPLLTKMTGKQILLLAAEHLSGNAHIFRNQLNETAKSFSVYSLIPETNHHLLEGLGHPKSNAQTMYLVAFHSQYYYSRNKTRFLLTEKISVQNGINFSIIETKGENTLQESLWLILYSSYLSYQLALINDEDPKKIEWVDYFKKELAAQDA